MMTLEGYNKRENLYQGTRTEVYRGRRTSDNKPVIIKVLQNQTPNFNQLVQFRNQYVITRNLEHPTIVQPLALERYGNGYALVMPDDGAIALTDYWQQSDQSLTEFLHIAIQLADALHYLGRERIVHKDIKPTNILIHPETGKVQLIDFSISSLLPSEQQQLLNPNVLEGTLAYIAPEQTGRMNRGIDYRSDFYSLGATLYQLLTGVLPFGSSDPMELVHCHISQQPVPPGSIKNQKSNIEIPLAVSQIVMKLMAKNAEDRYQSALGLKFDLENCLKQWKETGKIEPFELATRDIAGRFLIPEKLYGREAEVKTLLAAFDRVASPQENRVTAGQAEMMLVAGFSGIGKTAVVNEVHKPIVRQRGYFIKGKFDQFQRNIPFSAFVQAFRNLMEQLLSESDALLAEWQEKILAALGENGQVIIDVIPELELLIGKQPTVPELSGSAAQNRFNLLFQKFIKVFTTPDHPLVIFLDDLQWADSASGKLMELLNSDREMGYLLLLGAYRDNEVYPAHPLMLTLEDIGKSGASINTITLAALSEGDINCLVADTLSCSQELARPLTELIYQKTKGNPFFATQFLKGLHEDGLISFNRELGHWFCDITVVRQLTLTDDVVEFMASRLHRLPEVTQEILKLAACIGNQFDLETLAIVSELSQMEVASSLWKALQEGLVLPTNEVYKFYQSEENAEGLSSFESQSANYKFLHDRVQQAAYSLIANGEEKVTHLKIGQLLLEQTPNDRQESKLFDIVNHLNIAIELVTSPRERNDLVLLNLRASQKAKTSTAYAAASRYLAIAMDILPENPWEIQYDLTLKLYEERAEIEDLKGDFTASKKYIKEIIALAKKDMEKARIHKLLIVQYAAMAEFEASIQAGITGLQLLGIDFPKQNLSEAVEQENYLAEKTLGQRDISELAQLQEIENPKIAVAISLLLRMQPAGYFYNLDIWALALVKCARLLMKYGNTVEAAPAYVQYGLYLNTNSGQFRAGYKFGRLGVDLSERYLNKSHQSMTYCVFGLCLSPWVEPAKISKNISLKGYNSGLEYGNLQWAGYNLAYRLFMLIFAGDHIQDTLKAVEVCLAFGEKRHDRIVIDMAISCQKLLSKLDAVEFTETETEAERQEESDFIATITSVPQYLILKSQILYLQNQPQKALDSAIEAKNVIGSIQGNISVAEHNFYYSLSLLALHQPSSTGANSSDWQQAIANQEQMKLWADNCPENFLHRYLIVAAEMARVSGQTLEAIDLYDRAISEAKSNGYIQNEALANELAAKFYLENGKEKIAATYMQEAYYCYARWGAKAKTNQLEMQYPQLLAPILQQPQSNVNLSSTLKETQTLGTGRTTSSVLDLASAIKAGQAISEEISLDALLSKLMRIVIENAGANKGALVLDSDGSWEIAAQWVNGSCNLSTIPLNDASTLPLSIINTVRRTQQTLLINDIGQDKTFPGDPYLIQQQPLCLFCTPILHQGQLRGILYLENHLAAGAFTSDRIEVLHLLTVQAAISIENAQLYNTLEQKVKERTAELSEALEELKATQKQLVESEKMAALGGLVAGVAHEINTPIGTSITVASTLADETQSFLDAVKQGQLKRSVLNNYLDLADQSTQLMLTNLNRAGELIGSFKQIATDQSNLEQRSFELKEYLEEVALSLAPQLKPTPHTLRVAGSEGITIESYPGALAQIVTNLVTNSLTHGYPSGEAGQLRLQIGLFGDRVQVEYSDDGCGISQENLGKIFEPFFTTARNKGGTGLGLHIVYNLVTQKLLGTMEVSSEVGKGTRFVMTLPLSIK